MLENILEKKYEEGYFISQDNYRTGGEYIFTSMKKVVNYILSNITKHKFSYRELHELFYNNKYDDCNVFFTDYVSTDELEFVLELSKMYVHGIYNEHFSKFDNLEDDDALINYWRIIKDYGYNMKQGNLLLDWLVKQ